MTTRWFDRRSPRVIAHRGLAVGEPENTLPAFLHAMALGVMHLETDVHATSDGVAVLSHDPDLHRVGGPQSPIAGLTASAVRRIRLRGDVEIPTLAEALHAFPDACFNIDLKHDAVVEPAVAAIRRANAIDRVLVTSFDEKRRRRAVADLPGVATSASSPGVIRAVVAAQTRVPLLARLAMKGIHALQIPERQGSLPVLSSALVRAAHANGVEVHVWTVNETADMERLLDLGVDGLITDRADLAVPVVTARR